MKPRNKHERRIVELSSTLRPLTDEHKQWAIEKSFVGSVARSRNTLFCLECGSSWKEENSLHTNIAGCTCPECVTELKIRPETSGPLYTDMEYMAFLNVKDGFQVVRIAKCYKYMKKSQKPRYFVDEVLQQWINESGNLTIMAKNLMGQSAYIDTWIHTSDLSIKNQNTAWYGENSAYSVNPYLVHSKRQVIPILKRNGFKGKFHGLSPRRLFLNLINSTYAETLIKAKQFRLLQAHCIDGGRRTTKYWNTIKICIRNGYVVKSPDDWFDMLSLLAHFEKDLLNPKYVCPADLHKAHNYWVFKKQTQDKKKKDAERRATVQKAQKKYQKSHGRFIGLEFSSGDITVKFLSHVQQFIDAGDLLHHCIFTNEYYKKEKSVCFGAYHKDTLVETVEFDLVEKRINQSRGKNNNPTEFNGQIVDLVMSNVVKILNHGNPKRNPKSLQGQQRCSA